MPKCYQLIGVPASGKSTWINSQEWMTNCAVVSTDKWVDIFAKEVGLTYSEVFDSFMPTAIEIMSKEVRAAQQQGRDIVWDQTNTTAGSRAKKFRMLPDYEHIAVVFAIPDTAELDRRLASRPGKNIPSHVMRKMIEGFEMPTEEEGFTEIWFAG